MCACVYNVLAGGEFIGFCQLLPALQDPREVKNHSQRTLTFLKPSLGVCTSLDLSFSI